MKAFYYYRRDLTLNRRPYITYCFVTDGDTYARGMAVCSIDDNPCKKTGRRIAYGRAMRAFHRQVEDGGYDYKRDVEFSKCVFMPELIPIERKFMRTALGRELWSGSS